uniref:Hemolysin BL lytic component L1 n=1 Tax=Parastrongyloides trichosuri TaxID=131310 RepID=A0A0N4ZW91_PARTI
MTEQQENVNSAQDALNAKLIELYTTAINSPIGKYVEAGYNSAKTYNPLIENTVTTLETNIAKVANDYILPTAAKVYDNYSKGIDGTITALDKTKEAANVSTAYGLTAVVAGLQLGLLAGLTGANYALDTAKVTKDIGSNATEYVTRCKETATETLKSTIEKTSEIASLPKNVAVEQINYLLDITYAYAENITQKTIPKEDLNGNSSIFDRLGTVVKFLASNVYDQGNVKIFEPLVQNLYSVMNKIKDNFMLLDVMIKEKINKETGKNISEYLLKAKKMVEEKAEKLNLSPEQVLLEQIRNNTDKLDKTSEEIKLKGQNLLTPQINEFLAKIVSSIKSFDDSVTTSKSVYDVKDEVIQTIITTLSTVLSFSGITETYGMKSNDSLKEEEKKKNE